MNIEKAIDDCLIGLDLCPFWRLGDLSLWGWAERFEKTLAGILADYPVFIEESFGDGDVRLKLNSSQVENLVSDRIARLQEQLAKLDYGLIPGVKYQRQWAALWEEGVKALKQQKTRSQLTQRIRVKS